MKTDKNTSPDTWPRPNTRPAMEVDGRTTADVVEWGHLTDKVAEVAQAKGWSRAETARRLDMPGSTFSQWYNGNYSGRLDAMNAKVSNWLAGVEEMAELATTIPQKPPFQRLKMTEEIIGTLTLAQAMGDMVIVTIAAGNGKTEAARHYRATRGNVYLITASPQTRGVYGTLLDLAQELGLQESNPARLPRAVGALLERIGNGLIVVDEAQNLIDEAVNQLRHFCDNYNCGLALLGNEEVYYRFKRGVGKSGAQIKSRVAKRLNRKQPHLADLRARIAAWGVHDAPAIKFLEGVGLKAGAIRQIDKTLMLAGMAAAGAGAVLDLAHIKAAWDNRDIDGLAF
ncbi:AAA family ATPase [Candidatus Tokpelaia sp.]|uniref:AAA family ATPase n=1 Tax=Candidatus Tokpelaia sp. TaxID=2233777 RepID=UPI00123C567A|nr:AAA family ATPase [Candidatus Tokpelaia sp.]KAA6405055.1 DNA transposition protein [Candidatus Tokpelaia sp.]